MVDQRRPVGPPPPDDGAAIRKARRGAGPPRRVWHLQPPFRGGAPQWQLITPREMDPAFSADRPEWYEFSTGDEGGSCVVCRAMDGQLFHWTQFDLYPPLHPWCKCEAIPRPDIQPGGPGATERQTP